MACKDGESAWIAVVSEKQLAFEIVSYSMNVYEIRITHLAISYDVHCEIATGSMSATLEG